VYANGVQLRYEAQTDRGLETFHTTLQASGNHHNPAWFSHRLDDDEMLLGVEGRCGVWMTNLKMITNKREFHCGTSDFGETFSVRAPAGFEVIGLEVGVGGHIHNLALRVRVIPWSPKTHHLFPASFRQRIKALLLVRQRKPSGEPWHPESSMWTLPRDCINLIIVALASMLETHEGVEKG